MSKFRSKLKRNTKGKAWGHGQSATSNPENKKHRNKARSRFFQPNLSVAPTNGQPKESPLTLEAIIKHDARQTYAAGKQASEPTVHDIAASMKSFNLEVADDMGDKSELGTFQTYKTFASTYSACTNMTFNKLLNGFRQDSPAHKEMLAILAALTEVINERGGTQSSTEYFLALMETIDAATEDTETIAAVSLLNMGIKTVPEAILRKKFAETADVLLSIMKRYADDTDKQNVLRAVLSCMAALLRAQEYSVWQLSSTHSCFDAMLAFVIHSKPKIRKTAQQAVQSVIHGSCFMMQPTEVDTPSTSQSALQVLYHPAGSRVAKFCIQQFKPDNIANSHTVVLHTLGLLRDTINGFKSDDIKTICEHLLSIMTAANVLIRTNCFHVLHSLFSSKTQNLPATLTGRLISAIYEYRPEKTDVQQTMAWLTVLKQAHCCLAVHDLTMCVNSVPRLVDCCATDLWMTDRKELVQCASITIGEVFVECLQPACITKRLADTHRVAIVKCIESVEKGLAAPFGHVTTQVVLTFTKVFEVTGKFFAAELVRPLRTIGNRYDPENSTRLQIEHCVLAAIPSMGPEHILQAIPLSQSGNSDIELSRSWILPLLREAVADSTLQVFVQEILALAVHCNRQFKTFTAEKNISAAHTYELLCAQLWGLFPGFCRRPSDMFNFRRIAKTLGLILKDNAELRAPVLDGLRELLVNSDEAGLKELAPFARNFMPLLFNIYATKPTGSYEIELRASTLAVIREYLKVTPQDMVKEFYEMAKQQYDAEKVNRTGSFISEAIFDLIEELALYQHVEQLTELFDEFIVPVLSKQKKAGVAKSVDKLKRQQRKAYQLLNNILSSQRPDCMEFVHENIDQVQNLVLGALKTTCSTTLDARLSCIQILMERQTDLSLDNALVKRTIPEVIVAFNHKPSKRENSHGSTPKPRDNVALNLILEIGKRCQRHDKLNDFIDVLLAGFGGDTLLITNTILTLKAVVQHFTGDLTVATLQFILETVLAFLVGRNRSEVEAAVAFLITFIKVLPVPLVANHLPNVVRSLSSMAPDTKRYCRQHLGFILKKLCKRFTAEEIIKLVPGNDEETHKKLKNIRKEQNRTKRQRLEKLNAGGHDENSDDDMDAGLEKKSYTINDILADSDTDSDTEKPVAVQKKSHKQQETFIQEDADTIVDLADINAISRITTTRPTDRPTVAGNEKDKKTKQPNRGFKTAIDGRLIIAEPKRGEAVSDSDDDDAADDVPASAQKRQLDSDSDDEDAAAAGAAQQSRKRKAMDSHSMASGRTGGSSRYQTGGKGIHRPTSSSASVKSGMSRMSMATTKSASTAFGGGDAFRAKKAKGDMKKKGKLDPYAYIPLSRTSMNKRKQAKNAGQFKGIVAGARKGAAAGSKNRVHKAYRK